MLNGVKISATFDAWRWVAIILFEKTLVHLYLMLMGCILLLIYMQRNIFGQFYCSSYPFCSLNLFSWAAIYLQNCMVRKYSQFKCWIIVRTKQFIDSMWRCRTMWTQIMGVGTSFFTIASVEECFQHASWTLPVVVFP